MHIYIFPLEVTYVQTSLYISREGYFIIEMTLPCQRPKVVAISSFAKGILDASLQKKEEGRKTNVLECYPPGDFCSQLAPTYEKDF